MDPNFHPIIKGIYLLLGIQLIIVAIIQFIYGKRRQYAIAFISLILGLWFFRRFFWEYIHIPVFRVLFGGYKEFFIAPLFYFHLKMKYVKVSKKEIIEHFILPMILYIKYIIIKIFFIEMYNETREIRFWFFLIILWISYTSYFYLSVRVLRIHLKYVIIPKAYKVISVFVFLYILWYMLGLITTTLSRYINWYLSESTFWLKTINNKWIFYYDWNFDKPLLFVLSLFIIYYSIIELPILKKFFIPNNILQTNPKEIDYLAIEQKVNHYFKTTKNFLTKEKTLNDVILELNISKNDFSFYLKHNKYKNFNHFLNSLRVEEFKKLCNDKNNLKYDLVSLSLKAGFGSKATFNRVFKQFENLTPKEYIETINN